MQAHRKPTFLIILTVVAAVAAVGGYWVGEESSDTSRFFLSSSGGDVVFEHGAHTEMAAGCESCHHDLLLADSRQPCSTCHGDDVAAEDFDHDDLKTISAHSCETCHEVNDQAEAGSCRSCHPSAQDAEPQTVACGQCHDGYSADLMTHDEMQEIEGHACEGCHVIEAVSTVYHRQCEGCHLAESPEKFATETGESQCQSCHLR
ncbi:MAG TPA: cytochrome c3 family protein [Acidobacteriota bacterium]|nr:cytochrome c3 family protein [Acidobacteriota bacterium]